MNKQNFLKSVRADYRPTLVSVDAVAIMELPLPTGEVPAMEQPVPFAHPADDEPFSCEAARNTLRYLLSLAGLQYRFWWQDPDSRELHRYSYGGLVGSTGLTAAHDAHWTVDGNPDEALCKAAEFTSCVAPVYGENLPGLESRRNVLSEVLVQDAGDEAVEWLLLALLEGRVLDISMAAWLAEKLPSSFNDPYLKKAMLLLSMVASSWLGRRLKARLDICVFADYQVPNVLRHYGVLRYSEQVAELVDGRKALRPGSPAETAIRAATVLACEAIAAHFQVSAHLIDNWLFEQRRVPTKPFHLCLTEHY